MGATASSLRDLTPDERRVAGIDRLWLKQKPAYGTRRFNMYDWYEQNGYADEIEEPVDVRFLCEPQKVYLRPDRIYKFKVDRNCAACVELASHYE